MQRTLVMMRGLPGSGKSTLAREMASSHVLNGGLTVVICSTDNYHMIDGEYVFQPDRLGEFHRKNQEHAREHMLFGTELIIIDNTNIDRRGMKPYLDAAKELDYDVVEIIVGKDELLPSLDDADPYKFADYIDLCAKRNTHNVPREAIEKMARKFQK
jgi:tRNA uridine 5-carbamoylmethylation protein Kti12